MSEMLRTIGNIAKIASQIIDLSLSNTTAFDPTAVNSQSFIGMKDVITGIIQPNDIGKMSCIMEFCCPDAKYHFRPQFVRYRDANISSYLLLLKDDETLFIDGTYQILLFNHNKSRIKGVLGSGSLNSFGHEQVQEASLCDLNKRIFYITDQWADSKDLIQVLVKSDKLINPDNSQVYLEAVKYVDANDPTVMIQQKTKCRHCEKETDEPMPGICGVCSRKK